MIKNINNKILLLTVLLQMSYGLVLFYIKPYFSNVANPDEYFHWRMSLSFIESLHIAKSYPFLVHIIGGICFVLGGFFLFRLILLIFTFFLFLTFYIFIKDVFDKNVAFWSGIAYIFLFNSGFAHLFKIGTFANIIGDFFSILAVYVYYRCYTNENQRILPLLGVISFLCYFSHILSMITLSFLVLHGIFKKKKIFIPIVLSILLAFLIFPNILLRIKGYSYVWSTPTPSIRVIIIGKSHFDIAVFIDRILPPWLKPINILFPLHKWYTYLLFMGIFLLLHSYKEKKVFLYFLLWSIFVGYGLYFFNGLRNIWRISLHASFIKAFFTGLTLSYIDQTMRKKMFANKYDRLVYRSLVLFILFMIFNSTVYVPNIIYGIVYNHKKQVGIYDSFIWTRHNCQGNRVISIAIKEYRFLPIIANVTYLGDYSPNYDHLIEFCRNMSCDLIAVFTWEYRYPLIKNNPKFKEVYNNNIVAVFRFLSNFDG